MRLAPLLAALAFLPAALAAHEFQHGDLVVIHPVIPQPRPGAVTAAAYLTLSNQGPRADRLIGVETPAAERVTLHRSEVSADGVARMVPVEAIELPADDTVVLQPGGLHLMLLGLKGSLTEGQTVPATLILEQAGRVGVDFLVEPPEQPGAAAAHAH